MKRRLIAVASAALVSAACAHDDPLPSAALVSLMDAADSLHLRGEFDSARIFWGRALEEGKRQKIKVAEGRSLTGLGLASYRLGNYDAAQKELQNALAVQHDGGLDKQLPKTYNALGLVAYQQGRLMSAASYYDSSTKAATAVADEAGVAKAAGNLALVQVELGEFEDARVGFEKMRAAGQRLDDARLQGNALNNVGMLDIKLGNPALALRELTEAGRLYRSIDYKTGEQNNIGQLATAYAATGDYGRAFGLLDSALAMCRELKLRQEEASNLEVLATLHQRAGDPQRALRLFKQAQSINKELDLVIEQGANAKDRAIIERDNGRFDAAVQLAQEALIAHRKAEAKFEELNDLLLIAEVEQARGSASNATRSLRSADSVARRIGVPMARTRVDLGRARVAALAGNWNEVISALAAGPSAWSLAGYTGTAEGHTLRARAYARTGSIDKAIAEGREAIAAANTLRASTGSLEMKTRIIATHAYAYSDLIDALVTKGSISTAFEVADAAKGSTLLEYMEAASASPSAQASSSVTKKESLLRRIGQLELRRAEMLESVPDHNDSIVVAQLERRLANARNEYEELMARTSNESSTLIGSARVGTRNIQLSLAPDEALVEYHLTPERLHVFVLTRDAIKHVVRDERVEALAARVRLASDQMSSRSNKSTGSLAVLSSLHRSVIQPVDSLLKPGATLVIAAHGILRRIPFAALRNERGEWLVASHAIVQMPSGASLAVLRSVNETPAASAVSVFVPLPQKLPGTSREGQAVRRALPQSRSFVGSAATESALRSALMQRGIVHVATHGELNERNPTFSRIDMYPVAGTRANDDGRLEAHELLDQRLAADLVFLSGCETAAGASINPYQGGEEYSALSHILLNGRVRNVVATMWKIDDEAAALLAERFYLHLSQRSPALALAAAQTDLARSGRFAHPRFWAAYQFSGDGRRLGAHTTQPASVKYQVEQNSTPTR